MRFMTTIVAIMIGASILSWPTILQAENIHHERQLLREWQQRVKEQMEDGYVKLFSMSPLTIVSVRKDGVTASSSLINQTAHMAGRLVKGQVMICDLCLNPQLNSGEGADYRFGQVSLDDVKKAYENVREKPKAALWISFEGTRLSYRIVSLLNDRVIYSENIQKNLDWNGRSIRNFTKSRMKERLGRENAIFHHQWDLGLYPKTHLGYNFLNQWGQDNQNLSGFTFSFVGPTLALGVAHYKVLDMPIRPMVGAKVMVKLTELVKSIDAQKSGSSSLTGQVIVKVPFPGNMGGLMGIGLISTEGTVSLGVSW